jgi:hypothetical protein
VEYGRESGLRDLPGGFGTRQTSADDVDARQHLLAFSVLGLRLLGAVADFMERTNALKGAWENGLGLFADAIESQVKASEKLQKQLDLLRIEKRLGSHELK